ncbi:MAG: hypothetical protein ACFFHD_09760 [Promethearchaeota archaeon]
MGDSFLDSFFIILSLEIVIVTFRKKLNIESIDTTREFYNAITTALPSKYFNKAI